MAAKAAADVWTDGFKVLYQRAQMRLSAAEETEKVLTAAFAKWSREARETPRDESPLTIEEQQRQATQLFVQILSLPAIGTTVVLWTHVFSYQTILKVAACLDLRLMDEMSADQRDGLVAHAQQIDQHGPTAHEIIEARLAYLQREFLHQLKPAQYPRSCNRMETGYSDSEAGFSLFRDGNGVRDVLPYTPESGWRTA